MNEYRIDYSVTTHDGQHVSGTADVIDRTMTTIMARQYAANHLFDTSDVEPADIYVHTIDVEWEQA